MSNFKIGDKVRLKIENAEHSILNPTITYEVMDINHPHLTILDPNSMRSFTITDKLVEVVEIVGLLERLWRLIKKLIGR